MAIIPVALQVSGVAKNYNLCFVLATPGVVWSIGDNGGDYLGISYNATTLDNQGTSGIQRIEFTKSILTISTGPAVGSDFTLTAFIDVPNNVQWLRGHCILNEKARVSARLGDLAPVEWRDEINCAIPILLPDIHRATFTVRGVRQGQTIRIRLAGDGSEHASARWCAAPLANPEIGLRIGSTGGSVELPIVMFSLDTENIDLIIGGKGQGSSGDFIVEAYIEKIQKCQYCPPLTSVRIRSECDESVEITARIDNHRPQYLGKAYKLFAL
jgi:hypothetical protein